MSTLDILGNTSEQADSIRLMLKVRGMKDGRFHRRRPAHHPQGRQPSRLRQVGRVCQQDGVSDRRIVWHAAGVLRMLADDVEIMAREKEMGGGQ